jgi:peptide/nickel transport system substrate-binding protein
MQRRSFLKSASLLATGAAAPSAVTLRRAQAQSRAETLLSISEGGPNSLDSQTLGANRSVYEASWNLYDRLVGFGSRTDADGNETYDFRAIKPEIADDLILGDMSATFRIRQDRVFHDGTPVTARDIKWSLDRALAAGGVPNNQLTAASVQKPEQFVAVDDRTFRIDYAVKDKLTLISLGIPVVPIFNSALVQSHVTPDDPWGFAWTRNNVAGGGAFKLDHWTAGQELVMVRNEAWKSGPLPKLARVIWRVVPSAATRRALLEHGDADLSYDVAPQDAAAMASNPALKMIGTPMESTVQYLAMNVTMKPFDNPKVRQAVAYAVPYRKIMEAALYNRGRPLFGGPAKVTSAAWPQPSPYDSDLAKAKALLAEAGLADGFDVTLSFDLSAAATNEPLCVLVQEALGQIGIRVTIDKIPGANWRSLFSKKQLALQTNLFGAWFAYPDYYFYQLYGSGNSLFDTASYQNPAMDKLIQDARFTTDAAGYDRDCRDFIQTAFDDVPYVPLYQPFLNVGTRSNVSGYRYWFHRQIDYRCLQKT